MRYCLFLAVVSCLFVACDSGPSPEQVCDHMQELYDAYEGGGWEFVYETCLTDHEETTIEQRNCVMAAEDGSDAVMCFFTGGS